MEEKKVIRMDEHKNKNKVHKLSGKKILLGIVAVLILTVVIIAGTCKTKQIKISGLSYYTEAEVKKAVVENGYIDNSVAYFLKCKIASPDLLPFIDSIHVRINRPDTITVEVKEKKRAGCLLYNGKYVYFDKNGYALESYEKKYDDVPLVTGLTFDYVTVNKQLPVEKPAVFRTMLALTRMTEKYNITPDSVEFNENSEIILHYYDTVRILLGTDTALEEKMTRVAAILPSLSGLSGELHMEDYKDGDSSFVFSKDV